MAKKLKKINEKYYEEASEQTKSPLKWFKKFERCTMLLIDVRASNGFSAEYIEKLSKDEEDSLEYKIFGVKENTFKSYKKLYATGVIHRDRIGLINKEGEPSKYSECLNTVDVTLFPGMDASQIIANKDTPLDMLGNVGYMPVNKEYFDHDHPYVYLELPVPNNEFFELWNAVQKGEKIEKLSLTAQIEVFRSEVPRALEEPYHQREYYVEENGFSLAYASSIGWLKEAILKAPKEAMENADADEIEEIIKQPAFAIPAQSDHILLPFVKSISRTIRFIAFLLFLTVLVYLLK